jgi:hypothetical protein
MPNITYPSNVPNYPGPTATALLAAGLGYAARWRPWPRDAHDRKLPRPSHLELHNYIAETRPW